MLRKRFGCFGVILVVVLGLSLTLNLIFLVAGSASASAGLMKNKAPQFQEAVVLEGKGSEAKIALLRLRGIITSSEAGDIGESSVEDLKLQLRQAAEDDRVKAIVLAIDSPGGEVTASDSIYQAVRRVRDESKKPIVVHMGSLAASGGYYVACGGSFLMANETTLTGSIGVIMQTLNYEQLLGKVGLAAVTFKSGPFKDMLSGSRPMTEPERTYVQEMVMQIYGKFVGIVARERKLDEGALRSGVADGRVVSGKDALEAKLIDQLGELEDAYAKARELSGADGAAIIRYESPFKFGKFLRLLGANSKTHIEVKVAEALTPKLQAGRLYYLPSFYAP